MDVFFFGICEMPVLSFGKKRESLKFEIHIVLEFRH